MLLHRLQLSGFKSFVEPAELRIEPGLTGVVGPNGCGKSNLLEAIRWVMGENSPKSLRSGGMEDVIFAGTQTRAPRNFAEVILQGQDDDGEPLEVKRRIERGAGSAYRLNGVDVRAKDIALTFADAATGAHSPALVSQGKIAQLIAAKPQERRQMLEEAAGIAGLHVRRRDAESKLRQTEANLTRLEDLMAGVESQISSLRRQAKQAEKYRQLSRQISLSEARLLFAQWKEAAEKADAMRAEAKSAEAQAAEAQAQVATAQKAQFIAAESLSAAREDQADRRDDASAHGHRMASLTNQMEAAEQRLRDLERQRKQLEEDRGTADQLTQDAAKALARLEGELAQNTAMLAHEEAEKPQLLAAHERAEQAARAAEMKLAKSTANHAGIEAEWRVAEAEIEQAAIRITRLEEDQKRRDTMRGAIPNSEELAKIAEQAQILLNKAQAAVSQSRERLVQLQVQAQEKLTARDKADTKLAQANAEISGVERELDALQSDKIARQKHSKTAQHSSTALDQVRAAPGFEYALAAVLGRDGTSPLGMPAQNAQGRYWAGGEHKGQVKDSLLQHLSACPPELKARLALVHFADTDDGRTLDPGEWLVDKKGHLRRWDGFIARGGSAAQAAQLEADNRLVTLEMKLPKLIKTRSNAEKTQLKAKDDLSAYQQKMSDEERALQQAVEAERSAIKACDQAEIERERMTARLEELAANAQRYASEMEQAQSEREAANIRREKLPDPQAGRDALDAQQQLHDAARHELQSSTAALAAHDQSLAVTRERTQAQRAEVSAWQARSSEAAQRLSSMALRLEDIAQDHAVIAAKPESLMREIEQGETLRGRLAQALSEAEIAVQSAQDNARGADAVLARSNEVLAQRREARATLSARAEAEETRRSDVARQSGEKFSCSPPLLCEKFAFDEGDLSAAAIEAQELEKLSANRERIGPVNLVAMDELARLEQEQGTSFAEQEELAEAVARLRQSIGSLNREGRERLKIAFDQVDGHFRRLFKRLFEGGQAHLELIDSDDPLEAGLEIYAQPPGKRLQSLTLLSGGEQALTAIALIFALFLTNPAPICVLDEVDAPLDDANIDRFCDLLNAMNQEAKTRYLIVTHNAVTMSRMDRLFGVTMVEQGVSRLVSVDLQRAEQLVAEPAIDEYLVQA